MHADCLTEECLEHAHAFCLHPAPKSVSHLERNREREKKEGGREKLRKRQREIERERD